jgi:DNA-directed RNA polymerase specialized sigma24 family protein
MFSPRGEHALQRLDSDAILRHLRRARAAGDLDQVRLSCRILSTKQEPLIRAQVGRKVPPGRVDDVVQVVYVRCMALEFRGHSMGEFVNLVRKVVAGAVADFTAHNKRQKEAETGLPEDTDEGPLRELPGAAGISCERMDLADAYRASARRLSPPHRTVVELAFMRGWSGKEIAERIPAMTEANVHQIVSRFKAALRCHLREAA